MADYLLQEDGSSRIILEDASGDILLESGGPPPAPPQPGGIAVAPRRFLRERVIGRFRPRAAVVRVVAYPAILQVELAASSAPLRTSTAAPRPEFSFTIDAAHATAGFWKKRTADRETRIRKTLIAELFDWDNDNRASKGGAN